MKRIYDQGQRGAVDGELLREGYRIQTMRIRRPGKQVTDATIVALGQAIVAGDTVIMAASRLGISSKTGYRWKKRLALTAALKP